MLASMLGAMAGARADQNDPRLDRLFARLQEVEAPATGQRLTRRIWELWRASSDPLVEAAMNRGAEALTANRPVRAERYYTRVTELAPDYAEGWNKRATARYLQGRHAASAADIRRTLALEPRHFGALAGLGLVYVEIGRQRAAIDAFERALAINPHLSGTRRNLEMVRERLRAGET